MDDAGLTAATLVAIAPEGANRRFSPCCLLLEPAPLLNSKPPTRLPPSEDVCGRLRLGLLQTRPGLPGYSFRLSDSRFRSPASPNDANHISPRMTRRPMKPRPPAVESLWISIDLLLYNSVDNGKSLPTARRIPQAIDKKGLFERERGSSCEHDHDTRGHD